MKPIKIKKKMKCCANCVSYRQHYCALCPGEQIPIKIDNKGCKKLYKKNKHLYF